MIVSTARISDVKCGLAAGLAGGLAEIAWIASYQGAFDASAAEVAAEVGRTFVPAIAPGDGAVMLGLVAHMALAAMLGIALSVGLRSALPGLAGTRSEVILVVSLLAAVWAMNFFFILPIVNPAFIDSVPLGVSLISKLLFGVAAAAVFHSRSSKRSQFN